MKKHTLKFCPAAIIAVLMALQTNGQPIQSIQVNPPNPSTNDFITITVTANFPYSGCNTKTINVTTQGNTTLAKSYHCLGMLTTTCSDQDIINIGYLPAGSYNFWIHEHYKQGLPPCDSQPTFYGLDSIWFHVQLAAGFSEQSIGDIDIKYVDQGLHVITFGSNIAMSNCLITVQTLDGKTIVNSKLLLDDADTILQIPEVTDGMLIVRLTTPQGKTVIKRVMVVK